MIVIDSPLFSRNVVPISAGCLVRDGRGMENTDSAQMNFSSGTCDAYLDGFEI